MSFPKEEGNQNSPQAHVWRAVRWVARSIYEGLGLDEADLNPRLDPFQEVEEEPMSIEDLEDMEPPDNLVTRHRKLVLESNRWLYDDDKRYYRVDGRVSFGILKERLRDIIESSDIDGEDLSDINLRDIEAREFVKGIIDDLVSEDRIPRYLFEFDSTEVYGHGSTIDFSRIPPYENQNQNEVKSEEILKSKASEVVEENNLAGWGRLNNEIEIVISGTDASGKNRFRSFENTGLTYNGLLYIPITDNEVLKSQGECYMRFQAVKLAEDDSKQGRWKIEKDEVPLAAKRAIQRKLRENLRDLIGHFDYQITPPPFASEDLTPGENRRIRGQKEDIIAALMEFGAESDRVRDRDLGVWGLKDPEEKEESVGVAVKLEGTEVPSPRNPKVKFQPSIGVGIMGGQINSKIYLLRKEEDDVGLVTDKKRVPPPIRQSLEARAHWIAAMASKRIGGLLPPPDSFFDYRDISRSLPTANLGWMEVDQRFAET